MLARPLDPLQQCRQLEETDTVAAFDENGASRWLLLGDSTPHGLNIGEGAVSSIVNGIRALDALGVDVIIVGRG